MNDLFPAMNMSEENEETFGEFQEFGRNIGNEQQKFTKITAAQAKLLAELEVEVSVELGKVLLSVEQVLDLAEGQTFPLTIAEKSLVSLKVGDECVGIAQVISSGEGFALQIISEDKEN